MSNTLKVKQNNGQVNVLHSRKGEDNTTYDVTGPELLSADDMVTGGGALRKGLMAVLLDRSPFQGASVFLYCEKVHLKRMAYFIKIRFNF